MGFVTKVDFSRQVKQGSGEIAVLSGSTTILGNLDVYGMIMSGGTDISTLWGGGGSGGTNTFVTGGSLDGSYDLTLDYNTGGSATPISLSALSDNVVVQYANNLTELNEAFAFFTGTSTGGIVKMGASISLSSDLELDFDQGIELWGGGFGFTMNGNVITVKGVRATFRNVAFTGTVNFSPAGASTNSQNVIIVDDTSLSTLKFIECRMNDIVGGNNPGSSADSTYPIIIENCGNWSVFEFFYHSVGTQSGITTKAYGPFLVKWNAVVSAGSSGTRLMFKDWYCNSPERNNQAARFASAKAAMIIKIDGAVGTALQDQVIYDQSVAIDESSTWVDLDKYSTMWGPIVKQLDVNPTVTDTFGYPGDIQITGNSAYMKVGSVTSNIAGDGDTDWIQLGHTSNTPATCIDDWYVTNIHGCSPITLSSSVVLEGSGASLPTSNLFEIQDGNSDVLMSILNNGLLRIGKKAGESVTTTLDNTFIGISAGTQVTIGFNNTLVGHEVGVQGGTSLRDTTFVGHQAGYGQQGRSNTFIGSSAGGDTSAVIRDGQNITAIGTFAGKTLGVGADNNTFVGVESGEGSGIGVTGADNTAVGFKSLEDLTIGANNVALGSSAGEKVTTGSENVFIGTNTGGSLGVPAVASSGNTAVGTEALANMAHVTGINNVAIGYQALTNLIRQGDNIAIGTETALTLTQGSDNIIIGPRVDVDSSTDSNVLRIGNGSIYNITGDTTTGDIGIGRDLDVQGVIMSGGTDISTLWGGAGATQLSGLVDVGFAIGGVDETIVIANNGSGSAPAIPTGEYSLAICKGALGTSPSGNGNIGLGNFAGGSLSTGQNNVAVGPYGLRNEDSGSNNTALGFESAYNLFGGTSGNTMMGFKSGYGNAPYTSNYNTVIGNNAASNSAFLATGTNTIIGESAGINSGGFGNIFIGYASGGDTIGDNNIIIGYGSGYKLGLSTYTGDTNILIGNNILQTTVATNQFYLGSGSSNRLLLTGDYNTGNDTKLGININGAAPTSTLEIHGGGSTSVTNAVHVGDALNANTLFQVRDDGVIMMPNLPTSAVGLPTGALWNNSGVINIAP